MAWKSSLDEKGQPFMGFSILVAVAFLVLGWRWRKRTRTGSGKLPPAPPGWPVLGNLPLFARVGVRNQLLRELQAALGPLLRLQVGRRPLIFVASAGLAQEALLAKGSLFASRPLLPSRALFSSDFRNISASPYGPYWRAVRRNLAQGMLTPPKILSFKPARRHIIDRMIARLEATASARPGSPPPTAVAVYDSCRLAMSQLLLTMCLGFVPEDSAVSEISDLMQSILPLTVGRIGDYFPLLGFLDWKKRRRARVLRATQIRLFSSLIDQHRKLHRLGETIPGSYLETLLAMDGVAEVAGASLELSNSDLVSLCAEFLVGGTDTTVNCMEWTMAHLVQEPAIQAKIYQAILDTVGKESPRPVEEEDLPSIPYLDAAVKETLRLHPPGHFTLPHAVTEACELGGYDIPANAIVNFHVPSISRDPAIWEEPLEYRPERMLDREVDITGTKHISMLPFGAGRRVCPGAALALMHVQLFIARLVQQFEWCKVKPGEPLDMSEKFVFTVQMKYPLHALIKRREIGGALITPSPPFN